MDDLDNAFEAIHQPDAVTLLVSAVNCAQQAETPQHSLNISHDQIVPPI